MSGARTPSQSPRLDRGPRRLAAVIATRRQPGNGTTTVTTYLNEAEVPTSRTNGKAVPEYSTGQEFERFLRHTRTLAEDGRDPKSLRAWLDLAEAWRITQALRDCKGNRSAAARALGIGRRTLYAKMDKLGIEPSWQL